MRYLILSLLLLVSTHAIAEDKTAAAPAAAVALKPDTVAATVDGKGIKVSDIDEQLKRPEMAGYYQAASQDPNMLNQLRAGVLNSMISKDLLLDAAKKSKAVDPKAVTKSLDEFIAQQGGKEKVTEALKMHGVTWDQFMTEMSDGFTIRDYVEKDLTKDLKISDADIKKAFDAQPERYSQPERVRARHILLAFPKDATDAQKDQIKKKADDLYAKVSAPNADFNKIASETSEDPGSKVNGGDLGYFTRGMMVPEFEKTAFDLKTGEISKPVASQFGYHIIKGEDHQAAQPADYAKAKPQIEQELLLKARGTAVQEKLVELKKTQKVEIKVKELETPSMVAPS